MTFPSPFLLPQSNQGVQFYKRFHLCPRTICTLKIISHKKEVLKHVTMWISLENFMLSEDSQIQKLYIIWLLYNPTCMICPKYLNSETESRFLIARGQVREEWGVTINNYKVSFCGDENVLELELIPDHCTTVNILKTTKLHTSKNKVCDM